MPILIQHLYMRVYYTTKSTILLYHSNDKTLGGFGLVLGFVCV